MDKIVLERITNDTIDLACKIQNEIFPQEDARLNFIEGINNEKVEPWNNKLLGLKEQSKKENFYR